jgi:hypothetical protein
MLMRARTKAEDYARADKMRRRRWYSVNADYIDKAVDRELASVEEKIAALVGRKPGLLVGARAKGVL